MTDTLDHYASDKLEELKSNYPILQKPAGKVRRSCSFKTCEELKSSQIFQKIHFDSIKLFEE